jgi:hypothetical protein
VTPRAATDHPLARWGRPLVMVGAALFAISTAFPVVASVLAPQDVPAWAGIIDVGIAVLLVGLAFLADAVARGRIGNHIIHRSYRIYRAMAVLPLVLLVVFFLFGNSIRWEVLLPGLAWRAWLLIYALPSALALWEMNASSHNEGMERNNQA